MQHCNLRLAKHPHHHSRNNLSLTRIHPNPALIFSVTTPRCLPPKTNPVMRGPQLGQRLTTLGRHRRGWRESNTWPPLLPGYPTQAPIMTWSPPTHPRLYYHHAQPEPSCHTVSMPDCRLTPPPLVATPILSYHYHPLKRVWHNK